VINRFDNSSNFTALFGHNPGLTLLSIELCDCDIDNIPTCGVVLIEFPFHDWKLISAGTGNLKLFDFPKNQEA
jgi:phosphohistidine phosphatase